MGVKVLREATPLALSLNKKEIMEPSNYPKLENKPRLGWQVMLVRTLLTKIESPNNFKDAAVNHSWAWARDHDGDGGGYSSTAIPMTVPHLHFAAKGTEQGIHDSMKRTDGVPLALRSSCFANHC